MHSLTLTTSTSFSSNHQDSPYSELHAPTPYSVLVTWASKETCCRWSGRSASSLKVTSILPTLEFMGKILFFVSTQVQPSVTQFEATDLHLATESSLGLVVAMLVSQYSRSMLAKRVQPANTTHDHSVKKSRFLCSEGHTGYCCQTGCGAATTMRT